MANEEMEMIQFCKNSNKEQHRKQLIEQYKSQNQIYRFQILLYYIFCSKQKVLLHKDLIAMNLKAIKDLTEKSSLSPSFKRD